MREAAIAVVLTPDREQVLLVKRRDVPIWVLPGGGIEANESPSHAVERELFEETGLTATATRLVAEYTPINRLASKTYLFECSLQSPPPATLSSTTESAAVAFCSHRAPPQPFFFLHGEWIADTLCQAPHPLQKPIASVTWLALLRYLFTHPALMCRYLFSRMRTYDQT